MTHVSDTPWRANVQYGPDGEENYAWVVADDGALIGTFKTHHAYRVCRAVNSYHAMRDALEAIDAECVLPPQAKELLDAALAQPDALPI